MSHSPTEAAPAGKVFVGLSGGVDSAVAALRLLEAGWEVEALFMKNWEEDDAPDYCAAAEDLADAQAVADRLGIRLRSVNFAAEYWDRVFDHFLAEYRAGRTPNPDLLCNREIKFKAFLDYATDLGASYIATGHYARGRRDAAGCHLLEAADRDKDQTYFLFMLGQHALCRSLFPLGDLHKSEVRAIARRAGFANHAKKDSTGICFIGERRFRDFLAHYLPANPGDMQTPEGRVIGRHQGLMYYTLGQRQGLGVGGVAGADEQPWFVLGKDLERNVLLVGQGHDHPWLFRSELHAAQLHWTLGAAPAERFDCLARCRHRQAQQPCRVQLLGDDRLRVTFATPQRAVTPGQAVVLYRDGECLGGGIIC
ncbi:MAG: tRNA (5-methylaminomethyl-2-thiouridylate)-methyltransferase [Pseudomonadota bacterium]